MSKIGRTVGDLDESGSTKNAVNIDKSDGSCGTIFECEWEVFVVKYDASAGKFIGKPVCCALSPV